ncbi:hypothetical protein D3Z53_13595 [Lachnospiraceae bacterium]|nr:hypothetical protein [Lachnospiraceae bacterium]
MKYTDSFYYRSGKKHARIEYMLKRISETDYIYIDRSIYFVYTNPIRISVVYTCVNEDKTKESTKNRNKNMPEGKE